MKMYLLIEHPGPGIRRAALARRGQEGQSWVGAFLVGRRSPFQAAALEACPAWSTGTPEGTGRERLKEQTSWAGPSGEKTNRQAFPLLQPSL